MTPPPVPCKLELLARLHRDRPALRALGVARLRLFGSFARDEVSPASDVDLLVEFAPGGKTLEGLLDLADLLEASLQRRVELVTPEGLSPHVGPRILRSVEYVEA